MNEINQPGEWEPKDEWEEIIAVLSGGLTSPHDNAPLVDWLRAAKANLVKARAETGHEIVRLGLTVTPNSKLGYVYATLCRLTGQGPWGEEGRGPWGEERNADLP